jgi:prepilin-type processing-associated H-X9-DG protein
MPAALLVHPAGGELGYGYLRPAAGSSAVGEQVVIFEQSKVPLDRLNVGFGDGHVELVERGRFEKMLAENGTRILKFMLHISKKEQAERLQDRLDKPKHRWKFNPSDLDDRKLWDEFQAAYDVVLDRCSTAWAPWHVIPADHKWARNAAIAAIVRETLEEMNPQYPKPDWDPKSFVIK